MIFLIPAVVMAWTVTTAPEPEPEPVQRVYLGVDCSKPFMVSLPDDVLTECEREFTGR